MTRAGSAFPERWHRWSREIGMGMCYAALYCVLLAAGQRPSGVFSPMAIYYLIVGALLILYGVRLARRS